MNARIDLKHVNPGIVKSMLGLERQVRQSGLDERLIDLVRMRASQINGCAYCVHSHTAAARAKGMTPEMHAELLQVIAMAMQTNALATALGVEVDERFRA